MDALGLPMPPFLSVSAWQDLVLAGGVVLGAGIGKRVRLRPIR